MKTVDIIRRAGRSLRQAKGRTILTALAIAVGAFTIMMSLAAGEGTRAYTQNLIESNMDPQVLMAFKDKNLKQGGRIAQAPVQEYSTTKSASGVEMVTRSDIDSLKARSDVDWVEPFYQLKVKFAVVQGNDKKYTMSVDRYDSSIKTDVVAGNLPPKGQRIGENDMVVPESFAKPLGLTAPELVGKRITFTFESQPSEPSQEELTKLYATGGLAAVQERTAGQTKEVSFTVRAVTKENSSTKIVTDGGSAYIDTKAAADIAEFTTKGTDNYHKYFTVMVRAKDGTKAAELKDRLEKDNKIYAMTAEDMQQIVFQFVNVLQYIVIGFGILALIASVFGIINTQYISVLERTSQIGLMKALGMSNRAVGELFRYEAAWIGFLGGVIGIALAWVAVYFLNPWITNTLNLGQGNYLLKFSPISALVLLVALIVIAIVAGWFPSRKAARLDPIEALRTE